MVLANTPRHTLRVASGLLLLLILIFASFESKLNSQEEQKLFQVEMKAKLLSYRVTRGRLRYCLFLDYHVIFQGMRKAYVQSLLRPT